MEPNGKTRAPRNRTIILDEGDLEKYQQKFQILSRHTPIEQIENRTINQSLFDVLEWLPHGSVDLLFIDPPYNLTKTFNSNNFKKRPVQEYQQWLENWFHSLVKILKPTSSVYICGDWRSSTAIYHVAEKYLTIRNRITWEREKGRGAKSNWKNCSEDIWFCTVSDDYYFNVDAVKLRKQVIAPYRANGKPKDWQESTDGNYRLTHPSNLWTDLTVPFWSMPENTDHPTQKPEKLLAKIILASSKPGDMVLDPFLGSGTTSVVAKKLKRRYVGIEIDPTYCALAEKRLSLAQSDDSIQGYANDVFWERNTSPVNISRP